MWHPFSPCQVAPIALLSSPASAWPFLQFLLTVCLHEQEQDPRHFWICFSVEQTSWLTDTALFISVKGLCTAHRQYSGKTIPKHSQCLWKGISVQYHATDSISFLLDAAWCFPVQPQHGGPILCMVDTVVIASREKGKGKRRSTPWPLLAKLRSVCLSWEQILEQRACVRSRWWIWLPDISVIRKRRDRQRWISEKHLDSSASYYIFLAWYLITCFWMRLLFILYKISSPLPVIIYPS